MKKVLLGAAFALGLAGVAQADMVDYAEFQAGATFEDSLGWGGSDYDMETGFNVGGALGWHVAPQVDIEADLFFTDADYDGYSTHLESFSAMANAVYRIDCGPSITPYIGAGVGFAQIVYAGSSSSADDGADWTFAYQAFGGLSFPIADDISMFAEYRYQGSNDAELDDGTEVEYNSHNVSLGLHFEIN